MKKVNLKEIEMNDQKFQNNSSVSIIQLVEY